MVRSRASRGVSNHGGGLGFGSFLRDGASRLLRMRSEQGENVMPEEAATFQSAGLKLAANVRVPDGVKPGEKRAAFLVLHGFGSNKDSGNVNAPSKVLGELGYVTLAFDM